MRVEHAHRGCRHGGDLGVALRRAVPELPGTVQLVAEAPQPHIVGIRGTVARALVGKCGAVRMVRVFEQLQRGRGVAEAEVGGEHRLDARRAAPGGELVGAELVRLDRLPGQVEPTRTPIAGADAVSPVVAGDEVAAGVAHHRHAELAHQLQHVTTEAFGGRRRMPRLVDASVHAAAEVFDERAEKAGRRRADGGAEGDSDTIARDGIGGRMHMTHRRCPHFIGEVDSNGTRVNAPMSRSTRSPVLSRFHLDEMLFDRHHAKYTSL